MGTGGAFDMVARLLTLTLMTLLMLELLMRVLDPLGLSAHMEFYQMADHHIKDEAAGYTLAPGIYRFRRWSATMTANGRVVLNTRPAGCQIVAIGDSVTFGYGVNDADTWVNLLAREFEDVQWINAGVTGYNIAQIAPSRLHYPDADGFLYLVTGNDVEIFEGMMDVHPESRPYVAASPYLLLAFFHVFVIADDRSAIQDTPEWWSLFDALASTGNIQLFAHEPAMQQLLAAHGYDVPLTDYGDERVSYADAHPDAVGHQRIAAHMQPFVAAFISNVCTE